MIEEETINITEAKKHFSEIIGQVAFGKRRILITKRGKPMARLVPVHEGRSHLAEAKGWLDDNDPFFSVIREIIESRETHLPRVLKRS